MLKGLKKALLLILIINYHNVFGQTEYDFLKYQYDSLASIGNAEEALIITQKMNKWSLINEGDTSINYAVSFRYIGNCYQNIDTALYYYDLSKAYLIKQNRTSDPEYGRCLNNIGICNAKANRMDLAIFCYTSALNLYENTIGKDNYDYLRALINLGSLYFDNEKYNESELVYKKIELLLEKNKLIESEQYISNKMKIGSIYFKLDNKNKSEEYYLKAYELLEKINPGDYIDLANILKQLGLIFESNSDYLRAITYYERGVETSKKITPNNSMEYGWSLYDLAFCYKLNRDLVNSEIRFLQALEVFKLNLETNSPLLGDVYFDIGNMYDLKGDTNLLIQYFEEALRIKVSNNDTGTIIHANILNILGLKYTDKEKYFEGKMYLNEALRIRTRILGIGHKDTQWSMLNLVTTNMKTGDYDIAQNYLQFLINVFKSDSNNLDIKYFAYYNMGELETQMNNKSDAIKNYQIAAECADFISGNYQLQSVLLNEVIGKLYCDVKNWEMAEIYYMKIENNNRSKEILYDVDFWRIFSQLGDIYYNKEEYRKSELYYLKAISSYKKYNSKEDINLANSYSLIGYLYMELKEYEKSEKYLKESFKIKNEFLSNTDPILIDAYLGLGSLYQNMGMPILAEEFYLKALVVSNQKYQELDTNLIKTYFYLVDFYKETKEVACAIEYYQKIEEILKQNLINKPQLVDILIQEGFYYWDINDLPCAIEKMNMALENIEDDKGVNPKTKEVLYQSLGDLNYNNYEVEKSKYCYEKYIDITKNKVKKPKEYYLILQKVGRIYLEYNEGNKGDSCYLLAYNYLINNQDSLLNEDILLIKQSAYNLESYKNFTLSKKYYELCIKYYRSHNDTLSRDYIDINTDLCDLYFNNGELASAECCYLKAYNISTLNLNVDLFTQVLSGLGYIYMSTANYQKAKKYLSLALNNYQRNYMDIDYVSCLNNMGVVLMGLNELDESEKYFSKSLILNDSLFSKQSIQYINNLGNIGLIKFKKGDVVSGKKIMEDALNYIGNIDTINDGNTSTLKMNLGLLYSELGDYDNATELFFDSYYNNIKSLDTLSDSFVVTLLNLGNNLMRIGRYKEAEKYLLKAEKISDIICLDDCNRSFAVKSSLAAFYYSISDYKNFNNVNLELKKTFVNKLKSLTASEQSIYYTNLGLNNLVNYKYEEAERCFIKALELSNGGNSDVLNNSSGKYLNLGTLYYNTNRYDLANKFFFNALDIYKKFNSQNSIEAMMCLSNIGLVYIKEAKFDSAKYYLETVYNLKNKNQILTSKDIYNMGEFYFKMNDYEKLLEVYNSWIEIFKSELSKNFAFMNDNQKKQYWETSKLCFSELNNMTFKFTQNYQKANIIGYNTSILIKGLFLNNERDFRNYIITSRDSFLVNVLESSKHLKLKLSETNLGKNLSDEASLNITNKIDALEKILTERVGEYSSLKRRFELSWTDVRNSLKNNEATIEFSKYYDEQDSSNKYMAQVLRPNYEYPHIVKLGSEKEIEKYKAGNGLSELYHLVWEPIDSLLQGVETVYYSPDGMLYSVPFHALCMNDSSGCNYLMDKYTLHQLSTTRYLADSTLINTKALNNTITLYGGINYDTVNDTSSTNHEESNEDFILANTLKRETTFSAVSYLPGTKQEVESVVPLFNQNKWNTTIATGSKASEQLFKSYSDTLAPSIIHIATHGFAFLDKEDSKKKNRMDMLMLPNNQQQYTAAEDPMMRCGLMFAGANKSWTGKQKEMIEQTGQDGILTAAEVANMDLSNTKLVVLSACETGLGKIEGSEGVFGLQRGFKLAGVEQLIVSLWKVPDRETMELMNLFYTDLTITKDPVVSFSKAQKQMRNNYPDNPEKWAGFVLVR